MKVLTVQSSPVSCHSPYTHAIFRHSLCSSLSLNDQVSHPYNVTTETVDWHLLIWYSYTGKENAEDCAQNGSRNVRAYVIKPKELGFFMDLLCKSTDICWTGRLHCQCSFCARWADETEGFGLTKTEIRCCGFSLQPTSDKQRAGFVVCRKTGTGHSGRPWCAGRPALATAAGRGVQEDRHWPQQPAVVCRKTGTGHSGRPWCAGRPVLATAAGRGVQEDRHWPQRPAGRQ
jgi:hypothetical protein